MGTSYDALEMNSFQTKTAVFFVHKRSNTRKWLIFAQRVSINNPEGVCSNSLYPTTLVMGLAINGCFEPS